MVSVNLIGKDELKRKFNGLSDKLQGNLIKKALVKAAQPIRDEAKREAPIASRDVVLKRKGKDKVTIARGNLKKSIKIFRGKNKKWLNVQVGASTKGRFNGFYAHFVSEGHKTRSGGRTKENPFMKRAADRKEKEAVEIFRKEFNMILEQNFK